MQYMKYDEYRVKKNVIGELRRDFQRQVEDVGDRSMRNLGGMVKVNALDGGEGANAAADFITEHYQNVLLQEDLGMVMSLLEKLEDNDIGAIWKSNAKALFQISEKEAEKLIPEFFSVYRKDVLSKTPIGEARMKLEMLREIRLFFEGFKGLYTGGLDGFTTKRFGSVMRSIDIHIGELERQFPNLTQVPIQSGPDFEVI